MFRGATAAGDLDPLLRFIEYGLGTEEAVKATAYVSLVAGENVEIHEIYACEDWQADGIPGRKYGIQGPYTLTANDRQPFTVPATATHVCVLDRSDCDLSLPDWVGEFGVVTQVEPTRCSNLSAT